MRSSNLTGFDVSLSSSQTGLPNPQPDHAVIMAKFAHDCTNKLDRVVERLSTSLGEGTGDLALRSGMHSGEVTAGVLRGEKGRFQLFGGKCKTLHYPTCLWPFLSHPPLARWLHKHRYGEHSFENGKYWDSKTHPSVSNNS